MDFLIVPTVGFELLFANRRFAIGAICRATISASPGGRRTERFRGCPRQGPPSSRRFASRKIAWSSAKHRDLEEAQAAAARRSVAPSLGQGARVRPSVSRRHAGPVPRTRLHRPLRSPGPPAGRQHDRQPCEAVLGAATRRPGKGHDAPFTSRRPPVTAPVRALARP